MVRSRRRFVQGLAGGALAAVGARHFGWAAAAGPAAAGNAGAMLSGTEFKLEIGELAVNFTGQPGIATAVNGRLPAPLLRWREGDLITLRVSNRLSNPSSVHWARNRFAADMDGVPGLSFNGIGPGETYVYRFKVNQSGTYWYHSHSRSRSKPVSMAHRDRASARRAAPRRSRTRRVAVGMDRSRPEHIYRTLKRQSNYFNFNRRTVGDSSTRCASKVEKRRPPIGACGDRCAMDPTDLADASGHA